MWAMIFLSKAMASATFSFLLLALHVDMVAGAEAAML